MYRLDRLLVITLLTTLMFVGSLFALLPDIDYIALHGSNFAEYLLIDDDYAFGKVENKNQAFYDRLDASLYVGNSFEIGTTANFYMPRLDPFSTRYEERAELSKLYLGVDIEPVYLKVGTFEKSFQYGLTLYSFEDRDVNRENFLNGIMAEITPIDGLEFTGVGGVGNWDSQQGDYKVKAGEMIIDPITMFGLNLPFIATFDTSIFLLDTPYITGYGSFTNRIWSIGTTATSQYFDVAFVRAKHTDFEPVQYPNPENDGRAYYFSASGNIFDVVSVGFQYKDYRNFQVEYTQPPPCSVFEKSLNLSDEVGFLIEFTSSPINNLHLNFAYSKQTPHDKPDGHPYFTEMRFRGDLYEMIPRTDISFVNEYLHEFLDPFNREEMRFRPSATFNLTDLFSIKGMFEYEKRKLNEGMGENQYTDYIFELGASYAGYVNGSIYLEQTNEEPNPFDYLQKKRWIFYEVKYYISNEHQIAVGYGALRGGEVCSGGVCRMEEPFEGLRVRLTSVF